MLKGQHMSKIFSKIRHGVKDHIRVGRIKFPDEWGLYSWLHLYADIRTGIVYNTSAAYISEVTNYGISPIQKHIASLSYKGYIKRFFHRGTRKPYPIVINKFETISGLRIDTQTTIFSERKDIYNNKLSVFPDSVENLCEKHRVFIERASGLYCITIKDIIEISKEDKAVKKPKKKKAKGKEIPWPVGFSLNDKMTAYATKKGVLDIPAEFEAFRNWAKQDKKYIDWEAGWRTRCDNYVKFNKGGNNAVSNRNVGATDSELEAKYDGI